MPNCFQLTRKGEDKPMLLQAIDDEMCAAFGEPTDPNKWLWNWYDTIGLGLALGHDWQKLREIYEPEDADDWFYHRLMRVIDWLEQNFTAYAWTERGR